MKKLFHSITWSLIFFLSFILTSCATDSTVLSLQGTPQDLHYFLPDPKSHYVIKDSAQKKLTASYLEHYYSPWSKVYIQKSRKQAKEDQYHSIRLFLKNPGWGENFHPHSVTWAEKIRSNMNLTHHFNINRPAITTADVDVRVLPTVDPSFTNPKAPGKGYPFDNLQVSYLPANSPIYVYSASKDGVWYLILSDRYTGWVQNTNIAFVSSEFMKQWRSPSYATPIKANQTAFNKNHKIGFKTRIGMIYPLVSETSNEYIIKTAAKTSLKSATIQHAYLNKTGATLFPLKGSTNNIATVANEILGEPYGWGGIYGYRDCSSTVADIMTTFGIWLPRNSGQQQKAGQLISFKESSNTTKENMLKKDGIPFLTLVHAPGHIMLYVGEINGKTYVYHTMWGLRTLRLSSNDGRAVVGQTVITPMRFGSQYLNVKHSILEGSDSMTNILPNSDLRWFN